jgi:hypothetical protein
VGCGSDWWGGGEIGGVKERLVGERSYDLQGESLVVGS